MTRYNTWPVAVNIPFFGVLNNHMIIILLDVPNNVVKIGFFYEHYQTCSLRFIIVIIKTIVYPLEIMNFLNEVQQTCSKNMFTIDAKRSFWPEKSS